MHDCSDLDTSDCDPTPLEDNILIALSEGTEMIGALHLIVTEKIESMMLPCLECNVTIQETVQAEIQKLLITPVSQVSTIEQRFTTVTGSELECACALTAQVIPEDLPTCKPIGPQIDISTGFDQFWDIDIEENITLPPPLQLDDSDLESMCNIQTNEFCVTPIDEVIILTKTKKGHKWGKRKPPKPPITPRVFRYEREPPPPLFSQSLGDLLCEVDSYLKFSPTRNVGSLDLSAIIKQLLQLPPTGGTLPGALGPFFSRLLAVFGITYDEITDGMATGVESAVNAVLDVGQCSGPAWKGAWLTRIGIGLLDKYVAGGISEIAIPFEHMTHSICPTLFPDPDSATDAFLADAINVDTFESWLRIQNVCPAPWGRVTEARRSKLKPDEAIAALFRKIIDDEEYQKRIRKLGYLDPDDAEIIKKINLFVPGAGDIVGMMVRDVVDPAIVERFDLDTEFEQKYQGRLEEFGEAQGMDKETAKLFWRKHWRLPSPQQLSIMVHRLSRLPSEGVELREFIGQKESILNVEGQETRLKRVQISDVLTALKQDDFLPFWIDPMLAITFTPLTRVDIRRLLNIGEIDEAEAKEAYLQIGYNNDNADLMVSFAENLKNRGISTELAIRLWKQEVFDREEATARLIEQGFSEEVVEKALDDAEKQQDNHSAVKLYIAEDIDRREAEGRLTSHGINEGVAIKFLDNAEAGITSNLAVDKYLSGRMKRTTAMQEMEAFGLMKRTQTRLLEVADLKVQSDSDRDCLTAAKQRFLTGDVDNQEARQLLLGFGFVEDYIALTLKGWKCLLQARGKMPSTSQLCTWIEEGAIQPLDMLDRLIKIGWSNEDATNIVTNCLGKITEKQRKALEKEGKERAKLLEKARKDQIRVDKAFREERERLAKAAVASKKARDKRKKAIVTAADKLRDLTEVELFEAIEFVNEAVRLLKSNLALSENIAVEAVVLAISKGKPDSLNTFIAEAFTIGQEFVDEANQSEAVASNGSVN